MASTRECGFSFELYYCHDSMERQVPSKFFFCELRLVAAYSMSPWGVIVFWSFICLIVLPWGKLASCRQQGHETKLMSFLLPQVFIPSSFLHCFPPRHRMQQAHLFFVAPTLRHVIGCLASVDRSWWGQCSRFNYDLEALGEWSLKSDFRNSLTTPCSSWSDGG